MYSLLVPSLWMLVTWLTPVDGTGFAHDVLFWFGVVVTLIGLPAMVSLIILVAIPGAESVRGPGPVAVAIAVIATVGALSFIVGTQHARLLTCEEFTISGNDQPDGCTPARDVGG